MPRPNDRTVTTDPNLLAAFDGISYSYAPIGTLQPGQAQQIINSVLPVNTGNGSGTMVLPDDENEETKKDKTFFEKYQVPIILAGSVLLIGFAYFALFAPKK
jgi:hypothetical protein